MFGNTPRDRLRLFLILLSVFGCSEIDTVKTGELSIAPDEILFGELSPGTRVGRANLEIRNVGQAPIAVRSVRIEEDDELDEIVVP